MNLNFISNGSILFQQSISTLQTIVQLETLHPDFDGLYTVEIKPQYNQSERRYDREVQQLYTPEQPQHAQLQHGAEGLHYVGPNLDRVETKTEDRRALVVVRRAVRQLVCTGCSF